VTGTRIALQAGPFAASVRTRTVLVVLAAALLAGAVLVIGTARGDVDLPLVDVVAVLTGGGERLDRFVVLGLRLPRAVVGILVGFALGVAGAITQTITRNPLASPDLLGVSAGASAAAVAAMVGAQTLGAAVGVPLAALVGGLVAGGAIYLLAWRGGLDGFRLVLVGIGIAAFFTALTHWLLVRAELNQAAQATVWLTGSLNGRSWDHAVPVLVAVLVVMALAVPVSFSLRALTLGDETAAGLGARVELSRSVLFLIAVVLASVATASAGPVSFVALIAPQLALRLARGAVPPLIAAGAVGAVMLTGCDLLARTVLPVQLPVGVLTGLLGAPYLLYLIRRRNREVTT
jgi:iron complex transport system permease protein